MNSVEEKSVKEKKTQQSEVSILGPVSYGPSTPLLRHSAFIVLESGPSSFSRLIFGLMNSVEQKSVKEKKTLPLRHSAVVVLERVPSYDGFFPPELKFTRIL